MTRKTVCGSVAAVISTLMITGAAVTAFAAEPLPEGNENVDVNVTITDDTAPRTLTLTVAGTATTLTENGSTATVRQFTGALPEVTVTDTRTAEEAPEGASWYVLGTASAFDSVNGNTIGAEYLGWSPRLVAGGDSNVSVGGDVGSALDATGQDDTTVNRGLVDEELLYLGDAPDVFGGVRSSTASADLTLKVPATVTTGEYRSVITLSLFE